MLKLKSRKPVNRNSCLVYYDVKFEEDTQASDLLGQEVVLTDSKNKRTVKGTIHGVECDLDGIQAGESIVVAIWPNDKKQAS